MLGTSFFLYSLAAVSQNADVSLEIGLCPETIIHSSEAGLIELSLRSRGPYNDVYPMVTIEAPDVDHTIYLVRIGDHRLGDGRPESGIRGSTENIRIGILITGSGLQIMSRNEQITVRRRDQREVTFAIDRNLVSQFFECASTTSLGPDNQQIYYGQFTSMPGNRPITIIRRPPVNYPTAAHRERRQGRSTAEVTVDFMGEVTNCVTRISSGHNDLDVETCGVFWNTRFSPATDSLGNPRNSTTWRSIEWRI